jgi:hypothetical protein
MESPVWAKNKSSLFQPYMLTLTAQGRSDNLGYGRRDGEHRLSSGRKAENHGRWESLPILIRRCNIYIQELLESDSQRGQKDESVNVPADSPPPPKVGR